MTVQNDKSHPGAHSMRSIAPTLCWLLGLSSPGGSQAPLREVTEAMGRCERLAFIVIDSLGQAQLRAHPVPFLNTCAAGGSMTICAESPPYTPVNIATMTTGASYELHGVRKKRDSLRRETIFDIMARCAVKARIVTEKESVPAHFFPHLAHFSPHLIPHSDHDVYRAARETARLEHPDFLWIYFTGFDRACHLHGPGGEEAGRSLAFIDGSLAELMPLLKKAGYGLLFTADHGHHENPEGEPGMKGVHDGTREDDLLVPLFWLR